MFRGFVCGTKDVNATLSLFIPTLSNLRRPLTKSVVIKTIVLYSMWGCMKDLHNQIKIKSFIYHSPNSTAQIYIYNYDNLLCAQNMVVELCCYAGLSGSSAGLGIELALFSSRSCGKYKRISYMVTRGAIRL